VFSGWHHLEIISADQRIIFSEKIFCHSSTAEKISLPDIAPGIYVSRVMTPEQSVLTKKIFVE